MSEVALVTGATGLIGRYVVERLLNKGRAVRAVVRNPDVLGSELLASLDIQTGDLRDERVVAQAMDGVTEVFHLAACTRVWSRDPNEYRDVNIRAVELMLERAAAEGVERFVHVSTILTYAPHATAPAGPSALGLTPYEVTKKAGEALVERHAEDRGHAVIVHPTRVYGPGPLNDANAATRTLALYLNGRFRTRLADRDVLANYVHASDVAQGILLAAEHGRSGAHYVLGGPENVSFRDFLASAAAAAGTGPRWVIPVPVPMAVYVARAAVLLARLGGPPLITPEWVRSFLEDQRADIGPAQTDLGFAPRTLHDGLTDTIDWLRAEGYVR